MSRRCRTLARWAVLALAVAAVGCRGAAPPAEPATDGPLAVGCDTNFMPFEFERDGKYVGFDIDLWAEIAKELGRDFELRPMDFNGLIPALQAGTVDVAMAGMTIKAEREKVVDFSQPYYRAGLTTLVRADETAIRSVEDLRGRKVAARLGTTSADFAKKKTEASEVVVFPNIDGAYMDLRNGGVDAVIFDSPAVRYYANTAGKGAVKVVGPLYDGQSYGLAFPQGSALREPVNIALLQIMEDGRYDTLHARWFGDDDGPP